jgi:hypothetical protein
MTNDSIRQEKFRDQLRKHIAAVDGRRPQNGHSERGFSRCPHPDCRAVQPPTLADAAEMLWVVLANVSGGDWTKQSPEWQEAAARWRDDYFAALAAGPRQQATTYPIRAHVEGCANNLRVPVDLCDCGGRDFTPDPATPPAPPAVDHRSIATSLWSNQRIDDPPAVIPPQEDLPEAAATVLRENLWPLITEQEAPQDGSVFDLAALHIRQYPASHRVFVAEVERLKGLEIEIERLRAAIRAHRDARGDDRCWQDDETLYAVLPEGYTPPARDTAVELEHCKRYIASRQHPQTEYVSPEREIERLRAELETAKDATETNWRLKCEAQTELSALRSSLSALITEMAACYPEGTTWATVSQAWASKLTALMEPPA